MKCPLCGNNFDEKNCEQGCKNCPVKKKCNLVKCPNCGYEIPISPEWLDKLLKKREKDKNG